MRPVDAQHVDELARRGRVGTVLARMLVARGHRDPDLVREHLEAPLKSLHDPSLLMGTREAARRIARAKAGGELVLIHGDYDVDGVTGTALLMRLFELAGVRAQWYIPNRFSDGYSFGAHSVARARECGATVVVSVDNGTSAVETIAELARLGIDTIVTDHHEPPEGELPPAVAIVNPKLAGSEYPFRELCGAGVAFKLAWAVCQELSGSPRVREDLKLFLVDAMAYVALATVCDVVPLVGENRVLARRGLYALEKTRAPGLQALLEVAGLAGRPLIAEDVGYKLGPRLNAAGRLESAGVAVELLLATELDLARGLAKRLDGLNVERKRIEAELLASAVAEAERFADIARWPVLVVAGQGWHQGVVGVIAARLAEHFRRPALVIGLDGDSGRGSARSVPGFNVLDALHGGAGCMLKHGGHAQAAGCEVLASSIDALREAVCARAREMLDGSGYAERPLWIDCELPFAQMTRELMAELDRMEPYGEQNESPVLYSTDLRLAEPPRCVGAGREHLILSLRSQADVLKGLAFGMAGRLPELKMGEPLHVVYTPRWNVFRGRTELELLVHDFRAGERPALELL
jgi:single-stranded-DNA-specific exonuclease